MATNPTNRKHRAQQRLFHHAAHAIPTPDLVRESISTGGIPGVFKNTIYWLSRSGEDIPKILGVLPVAVIGTSPSGFGTILSQNAWLPVLKTLGACQWSEGKLMLSLAHILIDETVVLPMKHLANY